MKVQAAWVLSVLLVISGSAHAESISAEKAFESEFSKPGDPVSAEKAKLIREALSQQLETDQLTCTSTASWNSQMQRVKALQQFLKIEDLTVYVWDNGGQPAIQLVYKSPSVEVVSGVWTTADHKKIVRFDAERYWITQEFINTGTLTNPKFEIQAVRTPGASISCNADSVESHQPQ